MPLLHDRSAGVQGRGVQLVLVAVILPLLALASVIARFTCRRFFARKVGMDDWVVAGAVAFYLSQTFYKLTINPTKLSLHLLYLRIFPARQNPRFRLAAYAVMAYVLLYATASILATIFQCDPVPRAYDRSVKGRCPVNVTAFWYANAINNLVGDLLTLALPVPMIRKLRLPRGEKVGLYAVFGLGIFVCATTILRMTTLSPSSRNPDTTYGTMVSTLWSNVEANTGIVCACLPTLKRPLCGAWTRFVARSNGSDGARRASRMMWGGVWGRREEEGEGVLLPVTPPPPPPPPVGGGICKRTDVRVFSRQEEGEEVGWPGAVHLA
ncbi:MAG: hypothetical protein Q9219_006646 [cf. Caloplaca sp. 3 TL-2023]